MGDGRNAGLALVIVVATAGVGAVVHGAGPLEGIPGVLDRLTAPAVPLADRGEGRPASQPVQADPIPVPTPTAATVGFVALAGLAVWRGLRRQVVARPV